MDSKLNKGRKTDSLKSEEHISTNIETTQKTVPKARQELEADPEKVRKTVQLIPLLQVFKKIV